MPQWARIARAIEGGIAGERTEIKLHLTGSLVPKMPTLTIMTMLCSPAQGDG
jgi:hypothetical protein